MALYSSLREQSPSAPGVARQASRGRKAFVLVGHDRISPNSSQSRSPKREHVTPSHDAWSPRWLRITTIAAFAVAIIGPIIAIPILVAQSSRNNGLANGGQDLEYVLKFVPVAYFTLIAALWTRAELQAMRYTPWAAVAEGRDLGSHGLTLDYTDMFWWIAFWRSFKNRHMLVFNTMLVSLLLKVTIPLAAGLIHSSVVGMPTTVPVRVLDDFSMDRIPADFNYEAKMREEFGVVTPFYQSKAIRDFNMPYPFGLTPEKAYQTFEVPDASSSTQIKTMVDTITTDVVCDFSKSFSVKKFVSYQEAQYSKDPGFFADVEIEFDKCEKWAATLPGFSYTDSQHPQSLDGAFRMSWTYGVGPAGNITATPRSLCGLSATPREFLVVATTIRRAGTNDSIPTSFDITAALCAPRTLRSREQVSRNGTTVLLEPVEGAQPVDIQMDLDGLVESVIPRALWRQTPDSAGFVQWVFSPLRYAFEFAEGPFLDTSGPIHPVIDRTTLESVLGNFYRKLGSMAVHSTLRVTSEQVTTGDAESLVGRVLVNSLVAYILLCILGVVFLAFLFIGLCLPQRGLYDLDPTTILGAAAAFKKHPEHLRKGRTATGILKTAPSWEVPNTSPYILRSATRLLSVTLLVGLTTGLLVTLTISNTMDGIATISTAGYNPIVSSIVPTILLLLVSMYAGATNASIRNLSTFADVSARDCGPRELSISFLDMIGPRVLWHSTTRHIWPMTLTETAATLAAFLTAFAGLLFRVDSVEVSSLVQLQQQSWFGNPNLTEVAAPDQIATDNKEKLGTLLLNSTTGILKYTPGSYEGLVFPDFKGLGDPTSLAGNNVSIRVTVPALTMQSTCVDLPASEYNFTISTTNSSRAGPMCSVELKTMWSNGTTLGRINFPNLKTNVNGAGDLTHYPYVRGTVPEFGLQQYPQARALPGGGGEPARNCSGRQTDLYDYWIETYFWGKVLAPANKTLEYGRVSRCNYSWVEVDVDITMKGADLLLDYDNPPQPRWESKRAPSIRHPIPSVGGQWHCAQVPGNGMFLNLPVSRISPGTDRFLLVEQPFGSVPPSAYGSDEGKPIILEALTRMMGISYAQVASIDQRLGTNGTSMTEPTVQEKLPVTIANVSNFDTLRLIQRPAPTYVLVSLLGIITLINIYALLSAIVLRWRRDGGRLFLDMTMRDVAPSNSGSIAAMACLLDQSNILDTIPEAPENGMDLDMLREAFSGKLFRMGWFQSAQSRHPKFTVECLGDPQTVFLGQRLQASGRQLLSDDSGSSNYQ